MAEVDFFQFLMKDSPTKLAAIIMCSLQALCFPVLLLNIIWFERFASDKKRTLVNMMVSACCWTLIEFRLKTHFNFCLQYKQYLLVKYIRFNISVFCGILVLNKGTRGFTSNTLLMPKQDFFKENLMC